VAFLWNSALPSPLFFLGLQVAGIPRGIWFMAGALLFLAWSPQLLAGSSRIPLRSVVALGVLTALTVLHLWASWEYAVSYRGWLAVSAIVALSAGPVIALWVLYRKSARHPTFWGNLFFHLGVFAWLITLAFPSIGELP
jgi:hypothetical protein